MTLEELQELVEKDLKINETELQIPSDSELTEWTEGADALDETTEIYLED